MSITPDMIEEYFERYQWSYHQTSDNTWVTGVRTRVASFRIFLKVTDNWIYFVINPYVVSPPKYEDRLRFYFHALRLNLEMNMAKFGLDDDSDLFLAIELPTENFQYSHFSDALNGLAHYAELHYSEIFNLAHNPDMMDGQFDVELLMAQEIEQITSDLEEEDDEIDDIFENQIQRDDTKRPLDDIDLPEDKNDQRTFLGGKELKLISDENGIRIEFETPEDLHEDAPSKQAADEASSEAVSADKPETDQSPATTDAPTETKSDPEAGLESNTSDEPSSDIAPSSDNASSADSATTDTDTTSDSK